MAYKTNDWFCTCKKECRPSEGIDRRSFLKTTAAAAGTLGVLSSSRADARNPEEAAAALSAWNATLWEKGSRRLYRGPELEHIAFPLGGIGAGQVYLTGRGRLASWQIVNNFNAEASADGAIFGLWTRKAGEPGQARVLQEGDLEGKPGIPSLAFSGEYPFAWITYEDPANPLPVLVSLEAYSPMIPLQSADSGLPAAVFRFTLKNPSNRPVEASLLATAPNLAGWEGYGPVVKAQYAECIGNVNTAERDGGVTRVFMGSAGGANHRLDAACELNTDVAEIAWSLRLCDNLTVHHKQWKKAEEGKRRVYWLSAPEESVSPERFEEMAKEVFSGACVVFSGIGDAALTQAEHPGRRHRGRRFASWESKTYGLWATAGEAFGTGPVEGTLPQQQKVSGYRGKRLVNSFLDGDKTTGLARSPKFIIKREYIHLLVGGGKYPGETCINLMIDGEAAFSATGENNEQLSSVTWDVRGHLGKEAYFDIVDQRTDGWGHILVDDIVFSKSPVSPFVPQVIAQTLHDMLPFTWDKAALAETPLTAENGAALHAALSDKPLQAAGARRFKRYKVRENAKVVLESADGTPLLIQGSYGTGTVLFCNGAPERWAEAIDQKSVLGAIVALAAGTTYAAMTGLPPASPHFGTMALSAVSKDAEAQAQWDDFDALWKAFSAEGRLQASENVPSAPGRTWNAAVAVPMTLQPGESRDVRFVLSWHFPNRTRIDRYGWGPERYQYDHRLGNQYNGRFGDAREVSRYVEKELARLEKETQLFHDTFYDSTLPRWFLDCVTANASIARSPIYVWLEDGTVAGFEGSDSCCPMNCTHVYNYAMSMGYLFPDLERNVRETDLLCQMHPEEHYIPHRTVLPLSLPRLGNEIGGPHHHALDGELGTVLKLYREWRMSGEPAWLEKLWPNCKLVMEHVLKEHDVDGDGVIKGEQPNTYDTHLFGSNTFIGTLYLAALRSTEEMARRMGDTDFAEACRRRFESGRDGYDRICWDGEYYANIYDAPDATPETYNDNNCYGPGCHADQLLGQWWAHLLGLGYVLPPDHVKAALASLHRYCWRSDLTDHVQTQRNFASGTEMGLLNCSWPKGGRPERPILYRDEVWTGIEYAVAGLMLYEGMGQEAFQIIRGARDRYTGNQRNPWSEIECGGHYARAMSSWSLLHGAAGFHYHAGTGVLAFNPKVTPEDFKAFFTTGSGWGSLSLLRQKDEYVVTVDVRAGEMLVKRFTLPSSATLASEAGITVSGKNRCSAQRVAKNVQLSFTDDYCVRPGKPLVVKYRV